MSEAQRNEDPIDRRVMALVERLRNWPDKPGLNSDKELMNEAGVWDYVKRGLHKLKSETTPIWTTRIESSAGNGVPDVLVSIKDKHCWIELKYVRSWPKRDTTKVKLPLRPEQKLWISTRGGTSKGVFVLVRIEDHFYLLDHNQAIAACEGFTRAEWNTTFNGRWCIGQGRIDFKFLLQLLET